MELTVIGCLPHVPERNLVSSDPVRCFQNSGFVPDPQRNLASSKVKANTIGASVSGLKNENINLTKPVLSGGSKQKVEKSTECSNKKPIIIQSTDSDDSDGITLDMRVETEDMFNPIPIVAENISQANGICPEADFESPIPSTSSTSVSTSSTSVSTSSAFPEASTSAASVNDPSSDSYGDESHSSLDTPNAHSSLDSPNASSSPSKKKKRYLFLFRPSLSKILVKNSKTNINSYRCFVCGGIYRQKFSLKRHYLRSHIDFHYISEADIANCKIPVPSYVTDRHSNWESKTTSSGRKKFKKSSNDVFLENNESNLMSGLFRCHDCTNFFCNTELELKEHYNKHPDSIKKKFQCHICDASFFKKQILSRHLAGHGEKKLKIVCKRCSTEFTSRMEYQKHVATMHSTGKKCKYCSKILSTSANRKRHEAVHEGLKSFHCTHCDLSFAQCKDLDRHLRKQHPELCHTCSLCNRVFPSTDALALHMRQKHAGSPRVQESPSKSESSDKSAKPAVAKTIALPAAKAKVCHVCKRAFHTVYAMLKHKRNAHPFHSRRKRHKKTIKKTKKVSTTFSEYQRPYIKPSKSTRECVKSSGRTGPRNLTKREKELAEERAKQDEIRFYNTVHLNIAENLTNYVDGRASQLSLKEYNFNDLHYSFDLEERTHIPWSNYNFPQWYDVDNALKTKGHEIKRPENMSAEELLLYDATGLTPASSVNYPPKNSESEPKKTFTTVDLEISENLTMEEKGTLVGKCVLKVIVCYVCKEKFNSNVDFKEHCANNHPNVESSFVEVEGDSDSPPVIPPELCSTYVNSVGFRFSCNVPPQLSGGSLKCTKCSRQFEKCSELHEHVTICGDTGKSMLNYVPRKPNPQRRIKRTMKKRMTFEQQQAAFEANGFKTPEKRDSVPISLKSGDKMANDRSQFYKTGRPQTKSFTVDMNYFSTKPKKPVVQSLSKRGRKSYAFVSSMYRNGTIQAKPLRNVQSVSKRGRKSYATQPFMYRNVPMEQSGSSRECPACRLVFNSMQDLNNHISCSCPKLASHHMTKSDPLVKNPSYHKTLADRQKGSEPVLNSCKLPTASNFERLSYDNVTAFKKDNQPSPSEEGSLKNIPLDLSRNSKYTSSFILSQSDTSQTKSALDISMEKALTYIQEMKQNLQDTQISKSDLTGKNQSTNDGLDSLIPKPVVAKKVGRPRKLKKITAPAPLVLPKSPSDIVKKKNINFKPGRLEETIQKLTDRFKEKQQQTNSLPVVSVLENTVVPSVNSEPLASPNIILQSNVCQTDLIGDNSKSETTTVDSAVPEEKLENTALVIEIGCKSSAVPDSDNNNNNNLSKEMKSVANNNNLSSTELASPGIEINNQSLTFESVVPDGHFVKAKQSQDLTNIPSTEPSSVDTINQSVNQSANQGRSSSPTFESILKVINQKLHSEEQESSQQDDSAISWLEDEKFEIPPSRSKLNLAVPSSNVELLPTKKSTTTPEAGASKVGQSVKRNILTANVPLLREEQAPGTTSAEHIPLGEVTSISNTKAFESHDVNTSPEKDEISRALPESSSVSENISLSDIALQATTGIQTGNKKLKSPNSRISGIAAIKKTNDLSSFSVTRRRPGRPRRKVLEVDEPTNDATSIASSSKSNMDAPNVANFENLTPVEKDPLLNDSKAVKDTSSVDTAVPGTSKEPSLNIGDDDLETFKAPNSAEHIKPSSSLENDLLPGLSLRNFRSKIKLAQSNNNINLDSPKSTSVAAACNITTEFGKNLASRMKEKMRLSFDHEASKSSERIEESNFLSGAETSDTNSQTSNEDNNKTLRTVKRECDSLELTKIHNCPYCMLEFAYLTNFRRHIKKCKTRFEIVKDTEPVPGTPSTHLQHLPKKDEVDYSMLNLYRHQSRQTQLMKEAVQTNNQPISKYECTICHRIFLNLFNFMQHKTQHKLTVTKPAQENEDMDDMDYINNQIAEDSAKFVSETMPSNIEETENELNDGTNVAPCPTTENELTDGADSTTCPTTESELTNAANMVLCPTPDDEITDGENTVSCTIPQNELPVETVIVPYQTSENENSASVETGVPVEEINQPSNSADVSVNQEIAKSDEQATKRKRGRPFGWRKNASISPEKKQIQSPKNNLSTLLKQKMRKLQSVHDLKTKSALEVNSSKSLPLKKQKLMDNEDDSGLLSTEDEISNSSRNSLPSPKQMLKTLSKRLPIKALCDSENASSDDSKDVLNILKNPIKAEKSIIKTPSSAEMNAGNSSKRGRGRRPAVSPGIRNKPILKSVSPQKRKPGRPPKTFFSTPSTSQAGKSNVRSSRKMVTSIVSHDDSSDSDFEKPKIALPTKKKIHLKICVLCKEKFASNLELHRHIQLVHSRRRQPVVNKVDSSKIFKKVTPRSPSTSGSESIPPKRCDSPLKKSPSLKVCTICKKEFLTYLLLRNHLQIEHPMPPESAIKPDQPTTSPLKRPDPATTKPDLHSRKSEPIAVVKPEQLAFSSSPDISREDSDGPVKPGETLPKKQHHKVCAVCKKKFTDNLLLRNHLLAFHSRKSEPFGTKLNLPLRRSGSSTGKTGRPLGVSSPAKIKKENSGDRSSLSRQCRKPLPPLKRKRIKKEPVEQLPKKSKL